MAKAAADVRDKSAGFELLDNALQGRQPLRHQACPVAIAIEGGNAAREASIMITPGDALSGAKGLDCLFFIRSHGGGHRPGNREEDRALFIGQHQGLFRG